MPKLRLFGPDLQRRLGRHLRLAAIGRALGALSTTLVLRLAMICLTAIFGISAFNLYASRLDVARSARIEGSNLVETVGQQISRDIELLDLSLQDLRNGAQNSAVLALPPALRQMVLFDKAATAHGLGALMLLDVEGRVSAEAGSETPVPLQLGKESFFRVHADRADGGLFVSRPFVSLTDGEPSIALSRRVERSGAFDGAAVATIKISYFKELFGRLDLGPRGSIALMSRDGTVIVRHPFAARAVGRLTAPPKLAELLEAGGTGTVEDVSTIDGVRRMFFIDPLGSLPLTVVLGRGVDDIYAAWWRRAAFTGLALLLLGNLILVLIAALRIALRQRDAVEAELAILARTDKLTGLANRRRFDESLEGEWRRATRNQQPLALLLLDVDHFKAFNDHFGHQGGDAVLAAIGSCLLRVPRRAADLSARYGGEEFAVLLPNTTEADALRLARRVEAQVRSLDQPHPGSATGLLTVSIGLAVLLPSTAASPALLLRAADEALYAAKRGGRNRIDIWRMPLAA